MASKVVETVFRFTTDRAAINDVLRDSDRIDNALDEQRRSVERLEDAYTQMEQAARRVAEAERQASEARIRAAREAADIYGDVARRTSSLAGVASNLSPVLGQRLMIASDILDATEAAKLLHAELPKLTSQLVSTAGGMANLIAVGGLAGAAIAGLGLAISALSKSASESRAVVQAEIEFERRRAELRLSSMSHEDLNREIQALQEVINARQEHINRLKEDRDALRESYNALQIVGEVTGIANRGIDDLEAEIEDLIAVQAADLKIMQEYAQALHGTDAALNDALAAQDEYIRSLEDAAAHEIALQAKIDTYTMDQVRQETAALERERIARENQLARLQRAYEAGEISKLRFNAEAERLRSLIDDIRFQIADLNTLVRDAAKAREEEARRIEQFKKFVAELRDQAEKAANAIAETMQKIKQGAMLEAKYEADREAIVREMNDKIAEIEAARLRQRQEAEEEYRAAERERFAEHQKRLDELAIRRDERMADLRRQYERDELKRQADHQKTMRRAAEDHNLAVLNAAARLDASAVLAEQQRYEKEKRRAEEDFREEQKQRTGQLEERLKQEQEAYEKSRKQTEAAFREQERRQRQQFEKLQAQRDRDASNQIAALRKQAQDRLNALQQAHTKEIAQLFGFQAEEYKIRQEHYDRLKEQLRRFRDESTSTITTGGGTTAGSGAITQPGAPGPGQYYFSSRGPVRYDQYDPTYSGGMTAGEWYTWMRAGRPHFQHGGYTPNGLIRADAGEWIATRETTRMLERGIGAPLTQQGVQRFITSQSRSIGPVHVTVYESGDPERTWQAVVEAIEDVIDDLR